MTAATLRPDGNSHHPCATPWSGSRGYLTGCLDPRLDGPCEVLGEVELWQEKSHPLDPGNAIQYGKWLWVAIRYSARTAVLSSRVRR